MLDNDETSASTTEAVLFRDQHVEITKKTILQNGPLTRLLWSQFLMDMPQVSVYYEQSVHVWIRTFHLCIYLSI